MIVAAVAAGSVEMQQAILMIMGANIGTTITSNIVSLNYITVRHTFSRAFSATTLHDHFNIITTIILFLLQFRYNLLDNLSEKISILVSYNSTASFDVHCAEIVFGNFFISEWILNAMHYPFLVLLVAAVILFTSIKLFTNIIYQVIIGPPSNRLEGIVFKTPFKSFGWGALITGALQSSSVTTSFIVPLVATDKIKLNQVYPFIVGTNLTTTITALLATLFKSP